MTWSVTDEVGTWLTPEQYAEALTRLDPDRPVSVSTLMDWVRDGRHPAVHLMGRWYITPACLAALQAKSLAPEKPKSGNVPAGQGGFGYTGRKKPRH